MRQLAKIFLFLALWCAVAEARVVSDALGTKVTIVDSPQRIVTLAPSLAEIASDLVDEKLERIVGVSEYTDYPPALKRVNSIGPYSKINLEKIAALKPDLVLATTDGNPKDQIEHLRELRIPVVVVNTGNFSEVTRSIEIIGEALGRAQEGKRLSSQIATGIAHIQQRSKGRKPVRVMLQVGDDPVVVMGGKSFLNDTLLAVGAVNTYGEAAVNYLKPSNEDVVNKKPDLVLVISLGENLMPYHMMAKRWAALNFQVQVLQADTLIRPSVRLLEGLSLLEKAIYGRK
jgi:iron complex transport system substrate-binding protein